MGLLGQGLMGLLTVLTFFVMKNCMQNFLKVSELYNIKLKYFSEGKIEFAFFRSNGLEVTGNNALKAQDLINNVGRDDIYLVFLKELRGKIIKFWLNCVLTLVI